MKTRFVIKWLGGTVVELVAILLAGMITTTRRVQAQDEGNSDEDQLVHIGYAIAPVPLNLEGKNPEQRRLVGLGSFIVNAQADCNGCPTAGGPPHSNYANNGNPSFLNPPPGTKTDTTTYLAGGSPFGQAVPSSPSIGGFPPGSIPT